ncbi:MAG: serine/threonine protein kinase [Myxococcales bacterium]|nr:serine/threonine protein kinase [Myxococcales bacterium]
MGPVDPNAPTHTPIPGQATPSDEVPTWLPGPATQPGLASQTRNTLGSISTAEPQAAISRPPLPPGTIVDGHYRIDDVIGAGAMGVVYRAHHLRLDRPVALKLQRTLGTDTARLEREARAMARLDHPNVVGVYDVGMHDGDLYIAMEFVHGSSLRAWLAAGPHDWRMALEVCLQAGRGLQAAHAAGIIHRDFKPDNVLVGADGRVRVADFGIARGMASSPQPAAIEDSPGQGALGPDLTRTGSMPGTPAYMAPEQFEGRADARSDVFAFAVVLYEALWGARPFAGSSLPELLHNLVRGKIRAVPASSPVPPAILGAVLGGLAIDPRMRTASMAVLLATLERARVPQTNTTALAAAIAGAAIVAVGSIGGITWWLTRDRNVVDDSDVVSIERAPPEVSDEPSAVASPILAPTAVARPAPAPPAPVDPTTPPVLDDTQRAGKRALMDLMRGKDADPEALQALLESDNDEIVSATLAGVMMMDADAKADEGGFRRPGWDGTSKLICKLGDKFRFEKETLVLDGTAFQTMYGCQLQLIDCDITADVIAHVMLRSEVTIAGGTLRPRTKVIEQLHGSVTISGTTIVGTPEVGFSIMGGRLDIAEVSFAAKTAISASAEAQVTLVGGRIEGSTAAVDARARAHVTHAQTELVGPIALSSNATLEPAAAPP